jgi:CRP-like cAMP-binding protein
VQVKRGDEVLATLGAGEYVGELSIIDGEPRTADVVAADGGVTTFALPDGAFQELLRTNPEIAVPMLKVLARRLRGLLA